MPKTRIRSQPVENCRLDKKRPPTRVDGPKSREETPNKGMQRAKELRYKMKYARCTAANQAQKGHVAPQNGWGDMHFLHGNADLTNNHDNSWRSFDDDACSLLWRYARPLLYMAQSRV